MEIVLFATIALSVIAVLLSLETDWLKKSLFKEKKEQEDRIYKLSVLKDIREKTSYVIDAEKTIDIVTSSLRNFFDYSVVSSIVSKNNSLVFKVYVEERVGNQYLDSVRQNMLSSFSGFAGNLPDKIDERIYGLTADNSQKTTYFSSIHMPLIVGNKMLGLIHLSSTKAGLYQEKDMENLRQIVEIAASSMNRFSEALEVENHKFASLVSSLSDGVFMSDNQNNLFLINSSARKILKIEKENADFFDIANALSKHISLAERINEVIVNSKPFSKKGINVNDNIIDIAIIPVDKNKASIVLKDMTDYAKQEASKEDLMHIMVHELRAPATTIKDSAELLISTKDFEEDKKLKFLEIMHQQAKKILGQIGLILDSAKLDAGKLVLRKTKGDIANIIESEIQTFMPQAERRNISLKFNALKPSFPLIPFDTIRISDVIDNLLSNSLKFTPEKGKIMVEIDYRTISPKLAELSPAQELPSLDKYIIVSVSDTGIGIDKEQQKFLFSRYTQAKNTPEKLTKLGTGLGLYMIKGIVEAHAGRVWVKSAPGQGTTISFALPTRDDAETSLDAPKPNSSPLSTLSQTVN